MSTDRVEDTENAARKVEVRVGEKALRHGLLKALIVDDEALYRRSMKEHFESWGYSTEEVGSLGEAEARLAETTYSVVLCDNVFEMMGTQKRGSEFLRDHPTLLRSAKVILVTGFAPQQIADRTILENRGVRIVTKGPDHVAALREISKAAAQEHAADLTRQLENVCESYLETLTKTMDPGELRVGERVAKRAAEYLIAYVSRLPNQRKPHIVVGGRSLSPQELVTELRSGSELASDLIDAFLDDVMGPEDLDDNENH